MVRLSLVLKAGHTVEIIRRLAPSFEADTGIGLDIDVVSEDDAYDRLASGSDLPDVCTVPYWYLAEMVGSGSLIPLTASDYPGEGHPAAVAALTHQEELWAVPHTLTGGSLFVRSDLAPSRLKPEASSFEDFLSMWDQLIDRGSSVAIRAGRAFSSAETYRGLLYAAGVDAFGAEEQADVSVLIGPISDIVDRLRRQKEDLSSLGYAEMGELFSAGRAAMMFDTSAWATIYALDSNLSSQVAYGLLGQQRPAQFFYAEGLGITSACRNVDEAKAFIRWRHSAHVIQEEVTSLNRLDFPRVDLVREVWFSELLNRGTNRHVFESVMEAWQAVPADYPIARAGFVQWGRAVMAAISDAVQGASVADTLNIHIK